MKKFSVWNVLLKCDSGMKWANADGKIALGFDVGLLQTISLFKKEKRQYLWKCNKVRSVCTDLAFFFLVLEYKSTVHRCKWWAPLFPTSCRIPGAVCLRSVPLASRCLHSGGISVSPVVLVQLYDLKLNYVVAEEGTCPVQWWMAVMGKGGRQRIPLHPTWQRDSFPKQHLVLIWLSATRSL